MLKDKDDIYVLCPTDSYPKEILGKYQFPN